MSTVGTSTQATSASDYFRELIARRDKSLEEAIGTADENGQLSAKNKAALEKQSAKTDALVERALKDGKVTQQEFQKIAKAQENEKALLTWLTKDKPVKPSKEAGDPRPMDGQDRTLAAILDKQKKLHETVKKALASGKLTAPQKEALQKLETAEGKEIDKAMADGVLTRGEYALVTKAQTGLTNRLNGYQGAGGAGKAWFKASV
jgi:NCAIR mutase (PurE)-related protein